MLYYGVFLLWFTRIVESQFPNTPETPKEFIYTEEPQPIGTRRPYVKIKEEQGECNLDKSHAKGADASKSYAKVRAPAPLVTLPKKAVIGERRLELVNLCPALEAERFSCSADMEKGEIQATLPHYSTSYADNIMFQILPVDAPLSRSELKNRSESTCLSFYCGIGMKHVPDPGNVVCPPNAFGIGTQCSSALCCEETVPEVTCFLKSVALVLTEPDSLALRVDYGRCRGDSPTQRSSLLLGLTKVNNMTTMGPHPNPNVKCFFHKVCGADYGWADDVNMVCALTTTTTTTRPTSDNYTTYLASLTGRTYNLMLQGVGCGGHKATDCRFCPQGTGKLLGQDYGQNWCHGQCEWVELPDSAGKCELKELRLDPTNGNKAFSLDYYLEIHKEGGLNVSELEAAFFSLAKAPPGKTEDYIGEPTTTTAPPVAADDVPDWKVYQPYDLQISHLQTEAVRENSPAYPKVPCAIKYVDVQYVHAPPGCYDDLIFATAKDENGESLTYIPVLEADYDELLTIARSVKANKTDKEPGEDPCAIPQGVPANMVVDQMCVRMTGCTDANPKSPYYCDNECGTCSAVKSEEKPGMQNWTKFKCKDCIWMEMLIFGVVALAVGCCVLVMDRACLQHQNRGVHQDKKTGQQKPRAYMISGAKLDVDINNSWQDGFIGSKNAHNGVPEFYESDSMHGIEAGAPAQIVERNRLRKAFLTAACLLLIWCFFVWAMMLLMADVVLNDLFGTAPQPKDNTKLSCPCHIIPEKVYWAVAIWVMAVISMYGYSFRRELVVSTTFTESYTVSHEYGKLTF
mmetsp:Transcript_58235/g.104243  ORF Transcript_58235/g.104243 Transcript_58235/m.104243 type:complete len:799 (+) Transcript_58235:81-2477(+)